MVDKEGIYQSIPGGLKYRVMPNATRTGWLFYRGRGHFAAFMIENGSKTLGSDHFKFIRDLKPNER